MNYGNGVETNRNSLHISFLLVQMAFNVCEFFCKCNVSHHSTIYSVVIDFPHNIALVFIIDIFVCLFRFLFLLFIYFLQLGSPSGLCTKYRVMLL